MGASNELPESEELDALYDRFLLRRQVAQVPATAMQLRLLATLLWGMSPICKADGHHATYGWVSAWHLAVGMRGCAWHD